MEVNFLWAVGRRWWTTTAAAGQSAGPGAPGATSSRFTPEPRREKDARLIVQAAGAHRCRLGPGGRFRLLVRADARRRDMVCN